MQISAVKYKEFNYRKQPKGLSAVFGLNFTTKFHRIIMTAFGVTGSTVKENCT